MAITLISAPNNPSKWNAAHNDVYFNLIRRDVVITSCVDNGSGKALFYTSSSLSGWVANQSIYVNCGFYVGNFTILSVNSGNFTLNTSYIANSIGYANNDQAKENYYALVDIRVSNVSVGQYKVRPDKTGNVNVNIKSIITSLIDMTYNNDHGNNTYPDLDMSGGYSFYLSENWVGYSGAFAQFSTELYYANASMQWGEDYAPNMSNYAINSEEVTQAKFLTGFNELQYFDGFPFNLSFIFNTGFAGYNVEKIEDRILNGVVNNTEVTLTDDTGIGHTQQTEMIRFGNLSVDYVNIYLSMNDLFTQYYEDDFIDPNFIA